MPPGDESAEPSADSLDRAAQAEIAEAEAAEAETRAEAARARAAELRQRIDGAVPTEPGPTEPGPTGGPAPAPRRRRLPRLRTVLAVVAVAGILGLLGGTGYMLTEHRAAAAERHRTAEFQAAARQAVVNLMSMNYQTAEQDVQRLIDDSTGRFRASFQDTAEDLVKTMQDAKVLTKVTVNGAAVESMSEDSGVVLVAATSQREDPKATEAERQPQVWRAVVTLEREDGRLKMSEFGFS